MTCLPTRNPNKWWIPIVETNVVVKEAMTISGRYSSRANAVIFQNQGNCDLIIDDGFTLEPGQSLEFGNYAEINTLKMDVTVKFLPGTAVGEPVQRLEIIEMIQNVKGQGFYIDQETLKV